MGNFEKFGRFLTALVLSSFFSSTWNVSWSWNNNERRPMDLRRFEWSRTL